MTRVDPRRLGEAAQKQLAMKLGDAPTVDPSSRRRGQTRKEATGPGLPLICYRCEQMGRAVVIPGHRDDLMRIHMEETRERYGWVKAHRRFEYRPPSIDTPPNDPYPHPGTPDPVEEPR